MCFRTKWLHVRGNSVHWHILPGVEPRLMDVMPLHCACPDDGSFLNDIVVVRTEAKPVQVSPVRMQRLSHLTVANRTKCTGLHTSQTPVMTAASCTWFHVACRHAPALSVCPSSLLSFPFSRPFLTPSSSQRVLLGPKHGMALGGPFHAPHGFQLHHQRVHVCRHNPFGWDCSDAGHTALVLQSPCFCGTRVFTQRWSVGLHLFTLVLMWQNLYSVPTSVLRTQGASYSERHAQVCSFVRSFARSVVRSFVRSFMLEQGARVLITVHNVPMLC